MENKKENIEHALYIALFTDLHAIKIRIKRLDSKLALKSYGAGVAVDVEFGLEPTIKRLCKLLDF